MDDLLEEYRQFDERSGRGLSEYELQERKHEAEQIRLADKLLPAKNVRMVRPAVCATCKWGRIVNGTFDCLRVNGYQTDVGDMTHWFRVCDRYKPQE